MIQLIISIAMLALAPFIYFGAAQLHKVWKFLENIIIILVTSLVVLHLLPESIRSVGVSAIFLAFLGLFLPSIFERLWQRGAGKVHYISVGLALAGLVVHGMMDGAALAVPSQPGRMMGAGNYLQLAVILHRLPAALFIWGVFYPQKGSLFAATLLFILAGATVIGFWGGESLLLAIHNDARGLFSFQALVAGSLLHIAFDRHDPGHEHHKD